VAQSSPQDRGARRRRTGRCSEIAAASATPRVSRISDRAISRLSLG